MLSPSMWSPTVTAHRYIQSFQTSKHPTKRPSVCACVCARARACVCVCARACMCFRQAQLCHPLHKSHAINWRVLWQSHSGSQEISYLLILLPNFLIKHDCCTLRNILKNYLLKLHESKEIILAVFKGRFQRELVHIYFGDKGQCQELTVQSLVN